MMAMIGCMVPDEWLAAMMAECLHEWLAAVLSVSGCKVSCERLAAMMAECLHGCCEGLAAVIEVSGCMVSGVGSE
jgi:organic hydroperoxide reductase OsmC/OhrA